MTKAGSGIEDELLEFMVNEGVNLQSDLVELTDYSRGYISRILSKMENEGLIGRTNVESGKRIFLNDTESFESDTSHLDMEEYSTAEDDLIEFMLEANVNLQSDLVELTDYSRTDVSETLSKMEDKGLISRSRHGLTKRIFLENTDILSEDTNFPNQDNLLTSDFNEIDRILSGEKEAEKIDIVPNFKFLKSFRRSELARYFIEKPAQTTDFFELSEYIASLQKSHAYSFDSTPSPASVRKSLYPAVSTLSDNGFVVYDQESRSFAPLPKIASLGKLVEESDQKFEDVEPYEMFQTLSNSRRRAVLRYMDDNEEEVRVGDLARQIAGFENNFDVKMYTTQKGKLCIQL